MSLISLLPSIMEESQKELNMLNTDSFNICEEVRGKGDKEYNYLALGDNGTFMKTLLANMEMAGNINMVYIDPPFYSNAKYDAVIKLESDAVDKLPPIKHFAYEDVWKKGIEEYLKMMAMRLYLIKDLLAEDGTLWVHLDWHVVHYVKIILDDIFGEKNFVNEIIWNYKSGGTSKKHFSRKHDTILVYSKTPKYYFEPQKEKSYNRGYKPYRFKGVKEYKDELGWYTMVNMKDVWKIDMVGRTSSERTGYATQKPEALLERIIESATRPGDICADFFCGSGTLAAAAEKLGRRWICCDSGRLAVASTTKRLASKGSTFRVYETDNYHGQKSYGNADISFDFSPVEMTDMFLLKINLNRYLPKRYSRTVEDKAAENIKKVAKKDSLQLVEYWSIDFNYDGHIHKPEMTFAKVKNCISDSCEKLIRSPGDISIKIVDVFGNCINKTITKEELVSK